MDGLVLWNRCSRTATAENDEIITGSAFTPSGVVQFVDGGRFEGAYNAELSTTDRYYAIPESIIAKNSFTFSFWLKRILAYGTESNNRIATGYNSSNGDYCGITARVSTNNDLQWNFTTSGGQLVYRKQYGDLTTQEAQCFPINQWHHVAFVKDNGDTFLYVNGVSQDKDVTIFSGDVSGLSGNLDLDNNFFFGQRHSSPQSTERWIGYLCNCKIYNKAIHTFEGRYIEGFGYAKRR